MKLIKRLITAMALFVSVANAEPQISNDDASAVAIRDARLLKILNNAELSFENKSKIKINFKKIRGYQIGGSTWDNEQWAYVITVENKSNKTDNFSASLCFYDSEGFQLDSTSITVDDIKTMKKDEKSSDNFFISLNYIDKISLVKLKGKGLN